MENNKNNDYNKRYDKQNFNNKSKDIEKQMQKIDNKLKQRQNEINKELEKKQEEINNKIEQKQVEIINKMQNDLDEQIKTSISKKMREEEKKIIGNKNRKIITRDIIILLLIAIIGVLAYCLYDLDFYNIKTIITNKGVIDNVIAEKNNNSETTNNEVENNDKQEEKKEEKTSKYYIENYGNLLEKLQLSGKNELYFYKKSINKSEISNNVKLQIAYKNLDSSKTKKENGTITFNVGDLQEACREIFGKDATLNNEIFEYNNNKFLCYKDIYLGFLENNENSKSNVIYKIENAYEKNNELVFEITVAKKQDNKLLNVVTEQAVVENYNGEDILTYKNILSQYKFVYSKEEDNYYFKNVELVNANIPEVKKEQKPAEVAV